MEFLKKNYEKILLALVLLGLTAAVGYLTILIPEQKQKLDDMRNVVKVTNPAPLPPQDTSVEQAAQKRLDTPYQVDLVTQHRVFNPALWRIYADGHLRKVDSTDKIGPQALKLSGINPLYLTISYVTKQATGYEIKEKNDALPYGAERHWVVHPDTATDHYILKQVEGSPDSPTALTLEFKDTHETFTLKADPDQPFRKVTAYSADMNYPPDPANGHWEKLRPGTQ